MADSVYISANLSKQQLDFIHRLEENEIEIFHFNDIEKQLSGKFENLNEILENLVQKKVLSRIELFHRVLIDGRQKSKLKLSCTSI